VAVSIPYPVERRTETLRIALVVERFARIEIAPLVDRVAGPEVSDADAAAVLGRQVQELLRSF